MEVKRNEILERKRLVMVGQPSGARIIMVAPLCQFPLNDEARR